MQMEADERALAIVQEEYEEGLALPSEKPRRPFIVCPVGLIGAGKTTTLKLLEEKLPLLRISSDEIRRIFNEHGYNWDRASELALRIMKTYAEQGYAVAADTDCVNKKERLEAIANETRAELIWIHINTPEAFILSNLEKRPPLWIFNSSEDAIRAYWERRPSHEKLDFPFSFTLDLSTKDFHEKVDEIVATIRTTFFST